MGGALRDIDTESEDEEEEEDEEEDVEEEEEEEVSSAVPAKRYLEVSISVDLFLNY